jgi:hypothetical protein
MKKFFILCVLFIFVSAICFAAAPITIGCKVLSVKNAANQNDPSMHVQILAIIEGPKGSDKEYYDKEIDFSIPPTLKILSEDSKTVFPFDKIQPGMKYIINFEKSGDKITVKSVRKLSDLTKLDKDYKPAPTK